MLSIQFQESTVGGLGSPSGPSWPRPHDPDAPGLVLLPRHQHHRLPPLPRGLEAGACLCESAQVVDCRPAVHGRPHGRQLPLLQLCVLHHPPLLPAVAGSLCLASNKRVERIPAQRHLQVNHPHHITAALLLRRVAGGKEDINASMVIASFLDIFYALFLAIAVAGLANVVTTWVFFAVDFLFNAYGLFKIYKTAKSGLFNVAEDVLGLVQGMFIGLVVSLTYLASLVAIYHGPNAEVMGNIKNSYFDFAEITDLESTVQNILLIVGIETATSLVTIAILRFKCQIRPALAFLHLMKEYGLIISAQMLYWFYLFFCLLESKFEYLLFKSHIELTLNISNVKNLHR